MTDHETIRAYIMRDRIERNRIEKQMNHADTPRPDMGLTTENDLLGGSASPISKISEKTYLMQVWDTVSFALTTARWAASIIGGVALMLAFWFTLFLGLPLILIGAGLGQ